MNYDKINRVRKDIKLLSVVSKIDTWTKFIKIVSVIIAVIFIGKDIIVIAKNR